MASSLWPDSESKRNAARRVRRFSSVRDLRMDSSLSISCSLNWTGLRFLGKGMTPLKHKLDQMYRYLENDDLGNPVMPPDGHGGPAYTLSVEGTLYALGVGARVCDDNGKLLAPVDVVLEIDSRKPAAKHKILELYEQHGVVYPDT